MAVQQCQVNGWKTATENGTSSSIVGGADIPRQTVETYGGPWVVASWEKVVPMLKLSSMVLVRPATSSRVDSKWVSSASRVARVGNGFFAWKQSSPVKGSLSNLLPAWENGDLKQWALALRFSTSMVQWKSMDVLWIFKSGRQRQSISKGPWMLAVPCDGPWPPGWW